MSLRSPHAMLALFLGVTIPGVLAACDQAGDNVETVAPPVENPPVGEAKIAGSCVYTNPFSKSEECREYNGSGWTEATAATECKGIGNSTFTASAPCGYPASLGRCVVGQGTPEESQIVFPGEDTTKCASFKQGCEVFAGGKFVPDLCAGITGDDPTPPTGNVFEWPTESCVDPLAGEPAGQTGGKVCTWSAISGCTEAGRKFSDYGKCDTVLTQRPYWPMAPATEFKTPENDPIQTDPAYQKELAWVAEQVEACACACCHSAKAAPSEGTSNWYIEAPGIWTDTFYPTGLALAAGWMDSSSFGAYPPEENNGFSRDQTGVPTTDVARMRAFFEGELARRGFKKEDFGGETPFGGPLYDQSIYVPGPCEAGQGVDSSGKVNWTGGGARYVYVLKKDAKNPGVPPNLDLPDGTLWRIDVPSVGQPVKTGIAYGKPAPGTKQVFPETTPAEPLVPGETYLIYVLADVAVPITRCLFTY